ncbi:hypothetical protein K440DRAFT_645263 [Wilcoxina mikolae CBS 423.85]|nr:hypothetical protein K440DRAFT_645263 [Wilcoxina mikolae CBS 423.85]
MTVPPFPFPDPDPQRAGLITQLYQSCQKAWKLVIDDNVLTDAEEMHMARNEAGRFNIWGDGFGAGDGGLDELLDGLETMQETVVVLIARVAQKLLQRLRTHGTSQSKAFLQEISASMEKAEFRFPKAVVTFNNDYEDNEDDNTESSGDGSNDYEDNEDDSTESNGDGSNGYEEGDEQPLSPFFAITGLNDCLFDMTHSLETIPISLPQPEANAGNYPVIHPPTTHQIHSRSSP